MCIRDRQLETDALQRWPLDRVLVIHRHGRLLPGDRIVLCAATSAHREVAFEACAFLMDWLKTKAPFWKLEEIDGKCEWVEAKNTDDEAAAKFGGEPKTEMWYVLNAQPGAELIMGLRPGTTPAECRRALQAGDLNELLVKFPAEPNDAFYIPGGCVHALGAGCLILEVQQTSNTTYRLYDWDRMDAAGNPRELHIDQAFQVIQWREEADVHGPAEVLEQSETVEKHLVCLSPYFRVERWILREARAEAGMPETFQAFFCARGEAEVVIASGDAVKMGAGASCLVPACVESFALHPSGMCELLRITVP